MTCIHTQLSYTFKQKKTKLFIFFEAIGTLGKGTDDSGSV